MDRKQVGFSVLSDLQPIQLRLPWWRRLWDSVFDVLTTWTEAKLIALAVAVVLAIHAVSVVRRWKQQAKREAEVRLRLKQEMDAEGE